MNKEFMNLFLMVGILFLLYILFRSFNYNTFREGMTDASGNTVTSTTNGIAGNAASYGATIKQQNIQMQDTFLISKYRTDYENAILNLDDLIDNLMLKTALSVDSSNPGDSVKKLAEMNQAKIALNNVMKYVDKQQ